ncbi:hypothetical protein ACFYO0_45275 [Streptomyces sp. NPDC006365]|uniref:hypothetical protein n=1 Tax=Streptomyces sp. NPDC006365 TaxID=3364744 RepID=UPI0036BC616E
MGLRLLTSKGPAVLSLLGDGVFTPGRADHWGYFADDAAVPPHGSAVLAVGPT